MIISPQEYLKRAKQTGVQTPAVPVEEPIKQPSKLKSFATGVAKGIVEDGVATAGLLQGAGQRIIAAVDPTRDYQQVKAESGIEGLKEGTPERQMLDELLKSEDSAEKAGKISALIGTILIPAGKSKYVQTGVTKGAELLGDVAAKGGEAVAPIVNATGRVLKKAGETAYGTTVIPEESTRIAMQTYKSKQPTLMARVKNMVKGTEPTGKPITEANTAARYGLAGSEQELGVQAKRVSDKIWTETLAPKLKAVKGKVNMQTFLGDVEKEIASGTKGVRRTQLLESIKDIKNELKGIKNVSLEDLQKYKEDWAKFIPDSAYKGKTPGAALKEVQNLMSKKARGVIYKHIGKDGQQAYIDYGNLQSIKKAGIKSGGDPAKRSIGRNVWEIVMDKVVTPVATVSGKVLYRTGEGLEFVGKKGAKKVGDIIKQ